MTELNPLNEKHTPSENTSDIKSVEVWPLTYAMEVANRGFTMSLYGDFDGIERAKNKCLHSMTVGCEKLLAEYNSVVEKNGIIHGELKENLARAQQRIDDTKLMVENFYNAKISMLSGKIAGNRKRIFYWTIAAVLSFIANLGFIYYIASVL